MKILLTGFKPYDRFKVNVTEKIVGKISRFDKLTTRKRGNLKKVILPVVFEKKPIIEKIKRLKPDIILSLGEDPINPKGKLFSIERKAKNETKRRKGKIRRINQKGPKEYFVNLKLKKLKGARISYDAGTYVCNFLMYVAMDYIKKKNLSTKFAFIHIPQDFPLKKGIKIIEKILEQLEEN